MPAVVLAAGSLLCYHTKGHFVFPEGAVAKTWPALCEYRPEYSLEIALAKRV